MPNVWTHLLFAEELARIAGLNIAKSPEPVKRIYRFGSQGPDFLFYHRFLPWQGDSGMRKLGGAMHKFSCGPFMMDLFGAVRGLPVESPEAVYALGFLTHHLLDRRAHPYVFYRSGFAKWDHQRFEIIVDTLVVRKLLGLETWNTPVWEKIDIGSKLPGRIADILHAIARNRYPELSAPFTAGDWNDACRDMIRAQRLFHDPSGWKRKLTFGRIEPFVYKRSVPPLDYLNEERREWRHPSIEDERYSCSFWDLWEQALTDGKAVLPAAVEYLQSDAESAPGARDRLEALLGDISYETGKPCASGLKIRYADPMELRG
jgi:hypothetical protein